jgi:hypothetical protein
MNMSINQESKKSKSISLHIKKLNNDYEKINTQIIKK